MQQFERQKADANRELRWFVDDYCGCGPEGPSDFVSEACADAALMLQQQASG